MIFLRLSDHVEIEAEEGPVVVANSTRKYNQVTHFKFSHGEFEFFQEELNTKMIPKEDMKIFSEHPFILLETEHASLLYQDIKESSVFFVLTEDDDEILPTTISELTEDDTILIWDEDTEDYVYSEVLKITHLEWTEELDDTFSRYLIHANSAGLIINKILIA